MWKGRIFSRTFQCAFPRYQTFYPHIINKYMNGQRSVLENEKKDILIQHYGME